MIDIYVGESKRHWALHRNLLCHHSETLENELLGDANGNTRKDRLELPDHDPAGFELLVKWLYQGSLDDVSDMADENQKYDYAVSCHKLYLLCERFNMTQLKNVAMDQYRKGLHEAELVPDPDEIDAIYRKSPTGSPFRRLMTRIAARQIMDPANERDVETYRECFTNNPDFAIDLVKAIRSGTGGMLFDDPTDKGNECLYHDHEAAPNCYVKEKLRGKQEDRPVIRQIGPLHKLRPAEPPSPPPSPDRAAPSFSTASSPASSPSRQKSSSPLPDKSGEFDSWYIEGNGSRYSAAQSRRLSGQGEGQGKATQGDVSRSKTPRAVPSQRDEDIRATPSPRRAPPKLRRQTSPSEG